MADGGAGLPLRVLNREYTYDHRLARCEGCSLNPQRASTECLAQWPEAGFNGLAIIGEGPGINEARLKVPFIGDSGNLLNLLLGQVGIDRAQCFVSNASLCMPPKSGDFMKLHKDAIHACRDRLLAELQAVRPRVILALGAGALATLVGEEMTNNKRIPNPCEACGNTYEWRVWSCSLCKSPFMDQLAPNKETPQPTETPCQLAVGREGVECRNEPKKAGKWMPRKVACTVCGGHRTQVVSTKTFASDASISFVAGAVYRANTLQIGRYLPDAEHTYIVPTFHPSFLLRKAVTKGDKKIGGQYQISAVLRHLDKVRRLLVDDPVWDCPWVAAKEPGELTEWVNAALARDPRMLFSVDIETDNKRTDQVTEIKCVGFATSEWDVPAIVAATAGLTAAHPLIQEVCRILADPRIRKGGQNFGIYDMTVLDLLWDCTVRGYDTDTICLHHTVGPDEAHDLHTIGFAYTDTPPWKPPKKKNDQLVWESDEQLHEYNARDCKVTAFSILGLHREVAVEQVQAAARINQLKMPIAFHMTRFGMACDRQKMLEIGAQAQYETELAAKTMRDMVGPLPPELRGGEEGGVAYLNPNSATQVAWALFHPQGVFKLPATRFNQPSKLFPQGQPSTDKVTQLQLIAHPFVQQLQKYNQNDQVKKNYCDGIRIGPDMRIHPTWSPVKVVSGRWASSDPNASNWKKWARSMIVAPPGRKIVGADAAQIELRIMAWLSGDEDLISRCKNADESRKLEPEHDPHSFVASHFFGAAYTNLLLKDPAHNKDNPKCACQTCTRKTFRDIVKRCIYGLGYGAGAGTVHEAIYDGGYDGPPITERDVMRAIDLIFKLFPRFKAWRDELVREATASGFVMDGILGRKRFFPRKQPDETIVYNYPMQASAASIMDIAIINLFALLPQVDPTAGIIAQVHDAIYIECAEDKAPAVARLLEDCMSNEVRQDHSQLWMPLPAQANIADNWKEAA